MWGWVDDDMAMLSPWGFDLEAVRVPLVIRYGAKDVLVPAAHGAWLAARIPHAEVHVETSGHLSTPEERLASLRHLTGR